MQNKKLSVIIIKNIRYRGTAVFEKYLNVIEINANEICEVADSIYDNPETNFKEFKAVEILKASLKKHGFNIEDNLVGIPTAFKATFGEGKPHFGVLAEYDGLAGKSQVGGAPNEQTIEGKNTNHGCGHNLFAGGSLAAVLAVKEYIKETGKGKVTFFGCPAEEGGGGKVFMARDGAFNGVDAIVSHHPESMYMVRTRPALASITKDYIFTGVASHAGAAPHKGRSALDAVELMNIGANYLREHMELTSRVHYAIVDGGGIAPNIVQARAVVRYMVRAVDKESLEKLIKRVDKIAEGASLMTETSLNSKLLSVYSNLITIPTLQAVANESMHDVELPIPTKEEIAYGKKLQLSMGLEKSVLDEEYPFSMQVLDPAPPVAHGGSTDTADVSWVCPTVQMHIGNWVKGTPGHSWQSASQSKGTYAKRAMLYAGKAVAGTIIRLFENPELVEQAKIEHFKKTGGTYECLLPKDLKPLQ